MGLVITRKLNESFVINGTLVCTIKKSQSSSDKSVRIAFDTIEGKENYQIDRIEKLLSTEAKQDTLFSLIDIIKKHNKEKND